MKTFPRLTILQILIAAMIGVFFLVGSQLTIVDHRLGQGSVRSLNDNWVIASGEDESAASTLPLQLDVKENEPYTALIKLPEAFSEAKTLRLRSSMQDMRIKLNEEVVYQTTKPTHPLFAIPDASLWHFVNLPPDADGKTLSMTLSSPYRLYSGFINEVYYGEADALLFDLFFKARYAIFFSLISLILGALGFFVSLIYVRNGDDSLAYMSLLVVGMSFWILSDEKVMQFFTGNHFLIGSISYMVLPLIAISFLQYLKLAVLKRHEALVNMMIVLFLVQFILQFILQVGFGIAFIDSAVVSNTLILLGAGLVIFLLGLEVLYHKNRKPRTFFLFFMVFIVFLLVDVVQFFFNYHTMTSRFSQIGLLVFVAHLLQENFRSYMTIMRSNQEAALLSKLAYRDFITGGPNRAAFERDIAEAISSKRRFRLAIMDLNHLKHINDTHGHQEGDRAILLVYQALVRTFGDGGTVYRIGGDEFSGILAEDTEEQFGDRCNQLMAELERSRQGLAYPLMVAVGSDIYDEGVQVDFKTFFKQVDSRMYQHKRELKARQPLANP